MGDFVGGMLKHLRSHPIAKVTVAGGFAKLSKLATGAMDLHSKRSQVDKAWLAAKLKDLGADASLVTQAEAANTGLEILDISLVHDLPLGEAVASECAKVCRKVLDDAPIELDVLVFDRKGGLVGRS
jgi:cobalt-precorrin-5B (C1)-methyltransferase